MRGQTQWAGCVRSKARSEAAGGGGVGALGRLRGCLCGCGAGFIGVRSPGCVGLVGVGSLGWVWDRSGAGPGWSTEHPASVARGAGVAAGRGPGPKFKTAGGVRVVISVPKRPGPRPVVKDRPICRSPAARQLTIKGCYMRHADWRRHSLLYSVSLY